MKRRYVFWLSALLATLADILTKELIYERLPLGQRFSFIPALVSFQPVRNTGGVFGILQGKGVIFLCITFAAMVCIIWVVNRTGHRRLPFMLSLGLILGGGLGNLIDRLKFREVRDFIKLDFINWPVFNLADVFICIGWAVLLIDLFALQHSTRPVASQSTPQKG